MEIQSVSEDRVDQNFLSTNVESKMFITNCWFLSEYDAFTVKFHFISGYYRVVGGIKCVLGTI